MYNDEVEKQIEQIKLMIREHEQYVRLLKALAPIERKLLITEAVDDIFAKRVEWVFEPEWYAQVRGRVLLAIEQAFNEAIGI